MGTKLRTSEVVLLVIAGAAFGASAGLLVGEPILGGVAGGSLTPPLFQLLLTRRRRWIVITILVLFVLIAWRFVSPWAALIALACTLLALLLGAAILREWYGSSIKEAIVAQMRILQGKQPPPLVVSRGAILAPKGNGPFLGPRRLLIKPNTAVITELGTKYTNVLGPGIYEMQPFEAVRHIFDLMPRTLKLLITDVRTSDQLPVTIEMSILVGIRIPRPIRLGMMNMNDPADPAMQKYRLRLERIHDLLEEWQATVQAEIESAVRSYTARFAIAEMADSSRSSDLASNVVNDVNIRINAWGLWAERAVVSSIQPVRLVTETMEEKWTGSMSRHNARENESLRVGVWSNMVRTMADGYHYAHGLGMSPDAVNRVILMRMLERIIDEPDSELNLSAGLLADLREIRKGLGF